MNNQPNIPCRIVFDPLPWQSIAQGLRQKTHQEGSVRLRLVEYGIDFEETEDCTCGHTGYVVSGEMVVKIAGTLTTFRAGDALVIPAGEPHRHRHHKTIKTTTLFLVETTAS